MSIDAMKLALDALEHEAQIGNDDAYRVEQDALRAAIEQAQEQELVCVCGAIWEGQELVSAPSQRKPLTHPQIHELDWPDDVSFEDILLFARAVERAHGIKENT